MTDPKPQLYDIYNTKTRYWFLLKPIQNRIRTDDLYGYSAPSQRQD